MTDGLAVDAPEANDIAIVGMACRLPGAPDIRRFWANLSAGVESITQFTQEELAALGVPGELSGRPNFVPAGAQVEDVNAFDHRFWGYSPREAALLDPQQRLFLETAWAALENAGYSAATYDGLVGVYAGMGLSTYLLYTVLGNPAVTEADAQLAMLGNDKDFLSSRVSYHLDLRGPSLTVQTGCSTSLVATHLACDGLLSYQCDMALVGGASVVLPERTGYVHFPGSTASSDGHCRAFDSRGDGTVFGSGAGVIVLKRLQDALDDLDTVYAVIKGSAVNSDGANRVGFTAPSIDGQAEVVHQALRVAQVDPATISYVEAHGTGTELGDPVEIAALTKVFRQSTAAVGFCAIGSVKTNIGHLDAAAGVAGLIKTALAVHHGRIPPSINFSEPNPRLELDTSPFYVNESLTEWDTAPALRRAGVSAFGFGGTNAHVVLEQAPDTGPGPSSPGPHVLVLSAKTDTALATMTGRLAEHLEANPGLDLADVAHTLQRGRTRFEYRKALVGRDREGTITALRSGDPLRVRERRTTRLGGQVAFLFAGLGDQYPGMAKDLYRRMPVFRDTVDECCDLLLPHLGLDLRTVLYPGDEAEPRTKVMVDLRAMLSAAPDGPLHRTALAHPALFVVEYALARQWMSWGVEPSAMIGHSLGEYVAAAVAKVFPLDDALRIVAARAALFEQAPPGAMLAVSLDHERARELLSGSCSVALMNSPRLTAVSGPVADIENLERTLAERGVRAQRMRAQQGFHSPMVASVVAPLAAMFDGVPLAEPRIPFVSNVTGDWITLAQATDPNYWAGHSVHPVDFAGGLATLVAKGDPALVEIGPGQSLSALAAEHFAESAPGTDPVVLPSLRTSYDRRHQDDVVHLSTVLGQLWLAGVDVDWSASHGEHLGRRVALPTYPFERQRCRLDPAPSTPRPPEPKGRLADVDSWFLAPSWRSLPMPRPVAEDYWQPDEHWLVFADSTGLGEVVAECARRTRVRVTMVRHGIGFAVTDTGYRVDPADAAGYTALIDALGTDDRPTRVLHFWGLDDGDERDLGMHSLLWLARALAPDAVDRPVDVWMVARGLAAVEHSDELRPRTAALLAAAKCVPQEYEGVSTHCVDVGVDIRNAGPAVAARLMDLIAEAPAERVLAYRGTRRWVRTFEPIDLGVPRTGLRDQGVYVITGGLGEMGTELAGKLVDGGCRVVLIGRTPRESPRLRAIRERGHVHVFAADVTDEERMRAVFEDVERHVGPVNGVFHAAGLVGERAFAAINELDPRAIDDVMRAKATGTELLASLVRDRPVDFVVLVSSNAAVLGGLGTSAYTAGCVFLDTFAEAMADQRGTRWISIDLEDWLPDDGGGRVVTSVTRYGISPDDGVMALLRVAENAPAGVVTLVTGDLEERLDRWVRHPEAARRGRVLPGGTRLPRPRLDTEYEAPRGAVETAVAEIWSDLLGIDSVGRHDDFYQLGGHSLLAMQIVTRVRARYGGELSLLNLLRSPTVAGLVAAVSTEPGDEPVAIPLASRDEPVPLSFGQQRFWIIDHLAPGLAAYNVPDVARIEGPLRADVLHASVNDIVARHEALRTYLTTTADNDGEPVQRIAGSVDVPLDTVDLRSTPPDQRADRWCELARSEAHRPFNLAKPPLLRTTLLRLADEEHLLLLTMHHSVSDAWSTGVFVNELATHYAARCACRTAELEPLAVQYADYAVWQRASLSGARRDRLLTHWRGVLADAPRLIEFPPDRRRPLTQSFTGASVPLTLSAKLVSALRRLGGSEGATLFMTLLTAFNCLLSRYAGERDLVVGSPIAGRTRPELEPLIGTFTNMLALRNTIDPDSTLRELLTRTRDTTLSAYDHQELPFELVVEAVRPERTPGHSQIFQNVLVLQNAPLPPLELAGLRIEQVPMPSTTAKFDLMLMLRETADGAVGMIEYRTDLFTEETVDRIGRHFTTLLERMVADPDVRLADVALLSVAETALVTERWARGPELTPGSESIVDIVCARSVAAPDAVAIVSAEHEAVTFGELETWSNQLAHALRQQGIGRESRVGVCAERSPVTVVLLLAIMKAGAAYVPLDPTYPVARLRFMVDDAHVDLVVVDDRHRARLGQIRADTLDLDAIWRRRADFPVTAPACRIDPDQAAYILYTSGSTGVPKGILGLHGGMLNRLHWMWRAFPFAEGEVVGHKTSLSFLDSFCEIFGPLGQGVPLVPIPQSAVIDPVKLVAVLADHRVTRLVLVPSLLRTLLDTMPDLGTRLPDLRLCVSSGEVLTADLTARFRTALPGRDLLNLYGASEVSADVTWHLTSESDVRSHVIPLGLPIAATSVYILDERLRPVPPGVAGEIHVGGAALGRGYIGRPDLTADRFIPDPFTSKPGGRLYRTGDRGRHRLDGRVEYLGRRDDQVKIRGFRVEPTEIERALAGHPAIKQAVVTAEDDVLVAYCVADRSSVIDVNDVRTYLRGALPPFMVPTTFIAVGELPLTPTGKINRVALRRTEHSALPEEADSVGPRDDAERAVAELWCETLDTRSQVGVHDNFWSAGGYSLLAARFAARVREVFGAEFPLDEFFHDPTIAGVVGVLRADPRVAHELDERAALLLRVAAMTEDELDRLSPHRAPARPLDNGAIDKSGEC